VRVLITGAASGIGAALARKLSARGDRVALIDLREEPLRRLAGELGAEHAAADVRDRDGLTAAIDDLAGRLGGFDVAMANAGIATSGPLRLVGPDTVEDTIEINLLGVWRTMRAALPYLVETRGYLLCTASAAALMPTPLLGAYSASKAGVEALARAARTELAHLGVDVGVAYYLFLATPMVHGSEEMSVTGTMKGVAPGPIAKTWPLEPAIDATVAGIDERARAVVYPPFLRALLRLRGLADSALIERRPRSAMREAEAAFARDAERLGADAAARLPQDRPSATRPQS
jgi:NAD(P)-dependent dehydrogenase (short-subunit alcohol dehydrogenase family)